ncbi:MAG: hypothetical protein WCE54_04070 [Ignavibacteriaceae bacterium]
MLSFLSCSNDKENKNTDSKTDSLNIKAKKPKNYESIEEREWKEHRKDTLKKKSKNSDSTIIKYKTPAGN